MDQSELVWTYLKRCLGEPKTWLGWEDSNLRMAVPKTAALPLGYTPYRKRDAPKSQRERTP